MSRFGACCRRALWSACTIMILGIGPPARAQETPPIQLGQATSRTFDIAPQSLESALLLFGQQSGRQIAAAGALVSGRASPGVRGTLSVEEALRRLLAGTGLTYSGIGGGTITFHRIDQGAGSAPSGALQLDPLQVQGNVAPSQAEIGNLMPAYPGGEVARGGRVGALGNRDYMDTPFSTTVYTGKYIQDNQARTLSDAVLDDPTIRSAYGQSQFDDRLYIRGFALGTGDMMFNGLYGITSQNSIDLTGIERIEVFRGPTALLSGMSPRSAVGGTINLVPKRAPDDGITQLTARYLSNAQFGGQIDLGRRFGPDKSLGLRLNAAYSGGQTSISGTSDQLGTVTLGFDFRSSDTRLDADLGYTNRLIVGAQVGANVAPGLLVPPAPNAATNFYQPWMFTALDELYGDLRFEHDFTPGLTGYIKVGGRRTNASYLVGFPTIINTSGATLTTPRKSVLFNEGISAEVGGRAKVETGPLRHEAVLTGSWLRLDNGVQSTFLTPVASNLYAPVAQPAPNLSGIPERAPLTSQTVLTSIGVIDAISALQDRVQLIGGVRYQKVQVSNWNVAGTPAPGYDQSAVTPSASLIVKPWRELSLYGNFIQALEQGAIAGPGLTNAGQVFAPFVSTQFEVGAKLDLGTFGATLSWFQITKPASFVNIATNSLTVDGQQRNQGVEFTMFGEPLPGFRPIGGFTFVNAIMTNTSNGANNGKYVPAIPTFQANLGLEWDTPWVKGLTLGGRVIYTGASFVDEANLQPIPAWTRVDLSARYRFERPDGKPISIRGQVLNVGNANYWQGFLSQGAPRTVMLSLTADF